MFLRNRNIMKTCFLLGGLFLASVLSIVSFPIESVQADDITVRVSGPAGSRSQVIPGGSGEFDVNLPLSKNSVNKISVSAKDASGREVIEEIQLTQISFDSLVVAQVKTEPLPVHRIEQLVNDGVIDIDNPDNFNVSQFTIVLTIAREPVVLSIPIVMPKEEPPMGYETVRMPGGGSGGASKIKDREIIVFETVPPGLPVETAPRLPGVIVIDGRIKTLKEFYSVTFMMMNTSGIFTLQEVTAKLTFPDEGLSHTLPSDGIASLGVIPPGTDGSPAAAQKEFVIRGDEIGERKVRVEFAGKVAGPGIPEGEEVPFSGSAESSVEVKGPPSFLVQVEHPDEVVFGLPYNLVIDITNIGDTPALYTSLDLDMGPDAQLLDCNVEGDGDGGWNPYCQPADGPLTRSLGHIFPGQKNRQVFRVNPLTSGRISSCLGISDQNITLQVAVGAIGCLTGTYPPNRHAADAAPSVAVLPSNNMLGVGLDAAVVGIFSRAMNISTITTGVDGTFNVYDRAGELQPGSMRFVDLNGDTFAIWQLHDGVANSLSPNVEYIVELSSDIRDVNGRRLASNWVSSFTTTGVGLDDITPPTLSLSVEVPTNPNHIIPGELVNVLAYAADQGSGIRSVELRIKDLSLEGSKFTLIDRKNYLLGDRFPFIFTIDSTRLIPGHTYQLMGTAYDGAGNLQDATLGLILASTAPQPVIVLPTGPVEVLHGIPLSLTPEQVTNSVHTVRYFLNGAPNPLKETGVRPFQLETATLPIGVGTHTLRAVAEDGLGQTGEATVVLEITENNEIPTITFNSPFDGQSIVTGQVLNVVTQIEDPVGIKSITWRIQHEGAAEPTQFASGQTIFNLTTSNLDLGAYVLSVEAVNKLDISSGVISRSFSIIDPLPADPPAAPAITSINIPSGGMVSLSGTTDPNRRVDIRNARLGVGVTVYSNASGNFSASISAESGDTLFAKAYDLSLQQASGETSVTVPSPVPVLGLSVTPATLHFSSLQTYHDLSVTAELESGGTQNVTSQATYSSSHSSIASVNAHGRVVPVSNSNGESVVISVSYGGQTFTVPVTVSIITPVQLEVSPEDILFNSLLATETLSVDLRFSDDSLQSPASGVQFMSGNPHVATVDSSGLVTARGVGVTHITVGRIGVSPLVIPVQVDLGDVIAPQVSYISPPEGTTFERGGTVSISVLGTDDLSGINRITFVASGAATASLTRDISPSSLNTTQSFSFQIPGDAPIGGTVTVQTTARDAVGNESAPSTRQFTVVDATAPTVSVISPLPATRYNFGETISLVVQASDAVGVTEIRYVLEGSFSGADSQTFPAEAGNRTAFFDIPVPVGATEGDLIIRAFAKDATGNERESTSLVLDITNADITPPETQATASSDPGSGTLTTVTYEVLDGLDDLSHVELYFRRNGIGTFNRYTDPDNGNAEGLYTPQSGAEGTIQFDATKMGGDGTYEFYTVGVDTSGNREHAPVDESEMVLADQTASISSGMEFIVIDTPLTILSDDTSYDDKNIRVQGVTVILEGHHSFRNLELLGGAVLTHKPTTVDEEFGLSFEAWTLSIDASSKIDVSGRGYLGGRRDGNPDNEGRTVGNVAGSTVNAGGSYGGIGGAHGGGTPNAVYGNLANPVEFGSGGGTYAGSPGGNGGGKIYIQTVNIASDGALLANGLNGASYAGSGSGGAVKIVTRTLSGSGDISASGGGNLTGGGGGRIAIFYLDMDTKDTALIKALGAGSYVKGGNGTVFLKGVSEDNGSLVIDGEQGIETFSSLPVPPGFVFDDITLRNNARVIVNGTLEVNGKLSLLNNSVLTHDAGREDGVRVVANEVFVDASSRIDVNGKGYAGGTAPANDPAFCRGKTLGGALGADFGTAGSYGGTALGWTGATSLVYGAPDNPVYLGSGGPCYASSTGGNGGGFIVIEAAHSVQIEGKLSANGANGGSYAGSGSGGSIKITTSFIKGSGVIEANGGAGLTPAGGGRVAIFYDFMGGDSENFNNLLDINALSGRLDSYPSGPGTVFLKRSDQTFGNLYVDAKKTGGPVSVLTPLTTVGTGVVQNLTEDSIELNGTSLGGLSEMIPGSLVGLEINPNISQEVLYKIISNTENSVTVDISGKPALTSISAIGDTYSGVYRFDNLFMRRGGGLLVDDRIVVSQELRMQEHARMTHYQVRPGFNSSLDIRVPFLNLDSSSVIFADGKGYLGGLQEGNDSCSGITKAGLSGPTTGTGGSHAAYAFGYGSGTVNEIYGSLERPRDYGTGGPCYNGNKGGNGGGSIAINSTDIINHGTISSNGASGSSYAGSGSGGSVLIETNTLSGSGLIQTNGGVGLVHGSGGRIAVYYGADLEFPTSQIEARGNLGSSYRAGNGTVYLKSALGTGGDMIIDGYGGNTPSDSTKFPEVTDHIANIILRNNARVVADRLIRVSGNITLQNGSVLSHSPEHESGLEIEAENLMIDDSSQINVSGKGYRGGLRDGNNFCRGLTIGAQLMNVGGVVGGSYGGLGAFLNNGETSFATYGIPEDAGYLGTGGSCYNSSAGGNGGGFVLLRLTGALEVHGAIHADGQTGNSYAGSGSGGSISIEADTILGSGLISADGGHANVGGGGGRISMSYDSFGGEGSDFNGTLNITARGGSNNYKASAGTVLLKESSQVYGSLIVDQVSPNLATRVTPLTQIGFGEIQELTENQLRTDGGLIYLPGALVGMKVKPNLDDDTVFTVIANTEDLITVDVADGTFLTDVAAVGDTYSGFYQYDEVIIRRGGFLELADILKVTGDMTIRDGSKLTHAETTDTFFPYLDLNVGGTLKVVDSFGSGGIDVSGRGYLGGLRPGNPVCAGRTLGNALGSSGVISADSAGGSYGGLGAKRTANATPNVTYGDPVTPFYRGSGGSCYNSSTGGDGGGYAKIVASVIELDGTIAAHGSNGISFAGSGSGGGIYITTGLISGPGYIQANGGAAQVGGSGGRVSVIALDNQLDPNKITAQGGGPPSVRGEDGTVHLGN